MLDDPEKCQHLKTTGRRNGTARWRHGGGEGGGYGTHETGVERQRQRLHGPAWTGSQWHSTIER